MVHGSIIIISKYFTTMEQEKIMPGEEENKEEDPQGDNIETPETDWSKKFEDAKGDDAWREQK